jgi:hypothetical protein
MVDLRALMAAAALLAAVGLPGPAPADDIPALPAEGPVPEIHPAPAGNIPPQHPGDTPVPEAKPGTTDPAGTDTVATPPVAPAPPPSPERPNASGKTAIPEKVSPEKVLTDPRSRNRASLLMPPAEILCRQALRELGARFRDLPPEPTRDGCALPYPVALSGLADGVAVEPPAAVNCATAQALAGFMRSAMAPAAREALGSAIVGIDQASGYVCRPRAGTARLSEHAFGNALDIAAFRFADGRSVAVSSASDGAQKAFLDAVRKAACGPFRTVLGPGSDADHAAHLHLDLAPRRSGAAICQ